MSVANPYKNVWNSQGDHYGRETDQVGSAFVPTYLEMAMRSKGTAKNLLWKARKLNSSGNYTSARETFQEALSHQRIAKSMFAKHQEVVAKTR